MREIPQALSVHLAGDATTVCHGWRVTRRDGMVIGFTEHDRDLAFAGTDFRAASGFRASETEAAAGLAADAGEVTGGFSSDAISDADVAPDVTTARGSSSSSSTGRSPGSTCC